MHMKNTTTRCNDWHVLVVGPDDDEWTVMSLREAIEGDFVFESNGVRVYLDSASAMYLEGATVDYVDSLMGGGFRIENPNAVSTCSCGQSFSAGEGEHAEHAQGGGCACGHH